jgi:hypothetical protein
MALDGYFEPHAPVGLTFRIRQSAGIQKAMLEFSSPSGFAGRKPQMSPSRVV